MLPLLHPPSISEDQSPREKSIGKTIASVKVALASRFSRAYGSRLKLSWRVIRVQNRHARSQWTGNHETKTERVLVPAP
jgi:hypothetical protein